MDTRCGLFREEPPMSTEKKLTVWDATYDLLRSLGLTTMFGNPGSTEEPFLKNFPEDFEYILGLQEATAVAMADGFAQATGRPALLNLHTSAGTGNGMGNIMTAFQNKTPLIITVEQQTREMAVCDPLLTTEMRRCSPSPTSSGPMNRSERKMCRGRSCAHMLWLSSLRRDPSMYRSHWTTGISRHLASQMCER